MPADQRQTLAEELHKPARKHFSRRKYDIRFIDDLWHGDLVDMQAYSTRNNGFKYILTCIDAFSKHGWDRPLKSKEMCAVTVAFESILTSSGRHPKNF